MTAILGVSLGCRITGIAVVKGPELLTAHSITLRNKATNAHTRTLDSYIRQYRIATVVIKTPPPSHITSRLKDLLLQCMALFQYHGCMVDYKDARMIKECVPELANKRDIIHFATLAYPALTPYNEKELSNKQKYHVKMFEAVVIAHIKKQSLLSKNSP